HTNSFSNRSPAGAHWCPRAIPGCFCRRKKSSELESLSFAANSWGKTRGAMDDCTPSCRGGESGHANNQRKALHLGPADHAESVVFDASIPIIGHWKFEYSPLSCSATRKN